MSSIYPTTNNYGLSLITGGSVNWTGDMNGNLVTIDNNLKALATKTQTVRVATPSVSPSGSETVQINWPTPFSNNAYVVSVSAEDTSGYLSAKSFFYVGNGVGVTVRVSNSDLSSSHTGYVHVTATSSS